MIIKKNGNLAIDNRRIDTCSKSALKHAYKMMLQGYLDNYENNAHAVKSFSERLPRNRGLRTMEPFELFKACKQSIKKQGFGLEEDDPDLVQVLQTIQTPRRRSRDHEKGIRLASLEQTSYQSNEVRQILYGLGVFQEYSITETLAAMGRIKFSKHLTNVVAFVKESIPGSNVQGSVLVLEIIDNPDRIKIFLQPASSLLVLGSVLVSDKPLPGFPALP